jgi:hypothetical protein
VGHVDVAVTLTNDAPLPSQGDPLLNPHSVILTLSTLLAFAALPGCGHGGGGFSYQNVTISVSPHITSIPVNTSVTFTATTTNEPNNPSWDLGSFAYTNVGTPTNGIGPTYTYTAPATPPIYSGAASFNVPGTVTLQASIGTGENGLLTVLSDSQTFVITAPSVTVGLTPQTANVPLNGTLTLTGYAVGNLNSAVTLQVNGIAGGSSSVGTIAHVTNQPADIFAYTAPASMPMSGSTITVTLISQADPTKTASAGLTLQ